MCRDCGCSLPGASHTRAEESHEIEVNRRVLERLDAIAAENRRWLKQRNVVAVNLISSPGSGKTTLIEETLVRLGDRYRPAVIVGDQRTSFDAERLAKRCSRVVQIETSRSCHLDAQQVQRTLPQVVDGETRLLIIENVGNLVCPAAFDLGERCKIALLSITEGEDKPLKYPSLFMEAALTLITKTDLLPHLQWDVGACRRNLLRMNPDSQAIEVSAQSGAGMATWIEFLDALVG